MKLNARQKAVKGYEQALKQNAEIKQNHQPRFSEGKIKFLKRQIAATKFSLKENKHEIHTQAARSKSRQVQPRKKV